MDCAKGRKFAGSRGLGNVDCDEVIRDEHQHEHEQDTKVRGEK